MMPWYLSCLARAHAELGQFGDAWRYSDEAITTMETTKERQCEAEVYRMAGEMALLSPRPDAAKAEAHFGHALVIARKQQAKSWELRAAMSMCGSGASRASRTRLASFSLRSTAGSPRGLTRGT